MAYKRGEIKSNNQLEVTVATSSTVEEEVLETLQCNSLHLAVRMRTATSAQGP